MLAIQNQISVLSKILATKIQHQQILEHQQAVTAKLSKVVPPQTNRSRKTSSNETSSQCGSNKEKLQTHGNMVSSDLTNTNNNCDKEKVTINDTSPTNEASGCILS